MKELNFGDYYPQLLAKAANHQQKIDEEIKNLIKKFKIATFIGVGTSYNGAKVAKELLNPISDYTFTLQYSNTFYHNEKIKNNVLYILISQSGESKEIVKVAKKISKEKGKMIILSENTNSSLKKVAKHFLAMHDFKENTPFKSIGFASTIISLLKLFDYDCLDLLLLPKIIDHHKIENQVTEIVKDINLKDRFTFLGSGPDYGIALEGGLKINELAWLPAFCYETEDFFHGKDSYVTNNDIYLLFKNNYSCDYQLVKQVLLEKEAKNVVIIDCENQKPLINLFYKIYFTYALNWRLNGKFKRYPAQLRFRDLLKITKNY